MSSHYYCYVAFASFVLSFVVVIGVKLFLPGKNLVAQNFVAKHPFSNGDSMTVVFVIVANKNIVWYIASWINIYFFDSQKTTTTTTKLWQPKVATATVHILSIKLKASAKQQLN